MILTVLVCECVRGEKNAGDDKPHETPYAGGVSYDFDLFVIGGGSGGVRAARTSAALGAKVGLAESARMGGTCVNVGCVPKKLLVYGAHFAEDFEDARGFGWDAQRPSFSWETLIAAKDKEIGRLNGIYDGLLERTGVQVKQGRGSLVDAHRVRVGDEEFTAERILIATGGRPWMPEIEGADLWKTSDDVFALKRLPKSVVIAGGGYIGVEFAGIFRLLGAEVHIVHRNEHLLNAFDKDIQSHLEEQLRLKGIHLHLGKTVEKLHREGPQTVATLSDGTTLSAELQLAAVGRRPNTAGLNLEGLGIAVGHRGAITVNDQLQTSVPSVYALGDVIDRFQLTPVALAEGTAFAKAHFAGAELSVDYANIPTAVFSLPPVGTVGLSEEAAWHRGEVVKIFRSAFRPMKHTLSGRNERTMMKLVVCAKTDRVLGCHMVGPDAGEIIQGLAIAMKCGATKAHFDATIGVHPTAAEEFVTMREPVR